MDETDFGVEIWVIQLLARIVSWGFFFSFFENDRPLLKGDV